MNIYFDTCCLQRSFDDQSQSRIQKETEAIASIIALCDKKHHHLVSSEVLQIEVRKTSQAEKQAHMQGVLSTAEFTVKVNPEIVARAKALEHLGFKRMDALHLAAAEAAGVDYFCSCDDRLVRRAQSTGDVKVKVVNPLELAHLIT